MAPLVSAPGLVGSRGHFHMLSSAAAGAWTLTCRAQDFEDGLRDGIRSNRETVPLWWRIRSQAAVHRSLWIVAGGASAERLVPCTLHVAPLQDSVQVVHAPLSASRVPGASLAWCAL